MSGELQNALAAIFVLAALYLAFRRRWNSLFYIIRGGFDASCRKDYHFWSVKDGTVKPHENEDMYRWGYVTYRKECSNCGRTMSVNRDIAYGGETERLLNGGKFGN